MNQAVIDTCNWKLQDPQTDLVCGITCETHVLMQLFSEVYSYFHLSSFLCRFTRGAWWSMVSSTTLLFIPGLKKCCLYLISYLCLDVCTLNLYAFDGHAVSRQSAICIIKADESRHRDMIPSFHHYISCNGTVSTEFTCSRILVLLEM